MRTRPPRPEERQLAVLWGIAAVGTILLRPLWVVLAPVLPRCPLRALTGVPCPTCGSTHAVLALLDGRFADALVANPLATVAGLAFLAGGVGAAAWGLLGLPMADLGHGRGRTVAAVLAAALLVNWIWVIALSS